MVHLNFQAWSFKLYVLSYFQVEQTQSPSLHTIILTNIVKKGDNILKNDIRLSIWSFIYTIYTKSYEISTIKGTVSVMSCDPPCKEGNVWFTTIPLNHSVSVEYRARCPCKCIWIHLYDQLQISEFRLYAFRWS